MAYGLVHVGVALPDDVHSLFKFKTTCNNISTGDGSLRGVLTLRKVRNVIRANADLRSAWRHTVYGRLTCRKTFIYRNCLLSAPQETACRSLAHAWPGQQTLAPEAAKLSNLALIHFDFLVCVHKRGTIPRRGAEGRPSQQDRKKCTPSSWKAQLHIF